MYTPKNPFPIISQNVDLTKHRDTINKNIEKITSDYNKIFKTIDEQHVKDTFWNLAEGKKEYDPLNWYDVYATLLGRFAGMHALMEEGKISKEMYLIHREWSKYLTIRVGLHHFKIPKSFLINLFSDLPPVIDYETSLQILREGASILKEYNLRQVLEDPKESPVNKLRKFKETYMNTYSYFLKRCELFGNELSKYEDNEKFGNYGDKLQNIFQLYGKNELTPPRLVKESIFLLIHVRNSLVHSEYRVLDDGQIELKDRKWNYTTQIPYLWGFFKLLLTIDREFNNLALFIFLNNWIRELTSRYNTFFQCINCGTTDLYLILPYTKFFICNKCKTLCFI